MLEDGRLQRIGTDVDVRSIAGYLENPHRVDFVARHGVTHHYTPWENFGRNACWCHCLLKGCKNQKIACLSVGKG